MNVSAAEKAEQRRQKILARKKARMAYVAGDSTEPPSAASAEARDAQDAPATDAATAAADDRRAASATPAVADVRAAGLATTRPGGQVAHGRGHGHGRGAVLRSVLIAMPAGLAVAHRLGMVERWRVSAVELFVYGRVVVELCERAVGCEGVRGNGGYEAFADRRGSISSISTVVDIVSHVWSSLALGYRLWTDFCLHMLVFLLTWYCFQ